MNSLSLQELRLKSVGSIRGGEENEELAECNQCEYQQLKKGKVTTFILSQKKQDLYIIKVNRNYKVRIKYIY